MFLQNEIGLRLAFVKGEGDNEIGILKGVTSVQAAHLHVHIEFLFELALDRVLAPFPFLDFAAGKFVFMRDVKIGRFSPFRRENFADEVDDQSSEDLTVLPVS